MAKIVIDPLNRIEGHLSIEITVEGGRIVDARSRGDMFRGFETILQGRNPVDATMITQRICGVCPVSHAIASSHCLESAFNIKPTANGILLRNLLLAANYLQSHILHFYHLAAMDYVDIKAILQYAGSDKRLTNLKDWARKELQTKAGRADALTAVSPFLPRYEGKDFYLKNTELNIAAIAHYVQALDIRMKTHQMVALLGGKIPHIASVVPGGATLKITAPLIKEYKTLLQEVKKFVTGVYLPDVIEIARAFPDYFKLGGHASFLSYGAFYDGTNNDPLFKQGLLNNNKVARFNPSGIKEFTGFSHFKSASGLHPAKGETEPDPRKRGSYSWVKAPRYNGKAVEVGPLARILINFFSGSERVVSEVNSLMAKLGLAKKQLYSVHGRHAARAIECVVICDAAAKWLDQLDKKAPSRSTYVVPEKAAGMGLAEAPRGALGHWISIKDHLIDRYQCVVPTTWNASPMDDNNRRGPIEEALIGVPISDPKNPIEAARVVRSFDPCLACAIHVFENGNDISAFRVC